MGRAISRSLSVRLCACAAVLALSPPAALAEPAPAPAKPSAAVDLVVEVHADQDAHAISPLIYGINNIDLDTPGTEGLSYFRIGGNRMTGYNWETNASNAGADYHHQSDAYLTPSTIPAAFVASHAAIALGRHAHVLVTIPMAGYVAADVAADGDIGQTPDFVHKRLVRNAATKPGPLSDTPDLKDGVVYQDEFVHHLQTLLPKAFEGPVASIFFSLDNEPDLWASTHPRLRGSTAKEAEPLSYRELFDRSVEFATMLKKIAPNSLVFGPANYGWTGMVSFQGAKDGAGRDFLDTYLDWMRTHEAPGQGRLLDALDVHWYPEDKAEGKRITDGPPTDAVVAARVQAPRSLWDPTFVEPSWIGQSTGAVQLIPRLKAKIAKHYPGTALSISEYNYGGPTHISGGVAQADVLGVFGREGLFAANLWPLSDQVPYQLAGFAMYRNFDGHGGRFGNVSVRASAGRPAEASAYASLYDGRPGLMSVVLVNKTTSPKRTALEIWHSERFAQAHLYSLTAADGPHPHDDGTRPLTGQNLLTLTLPAMSVTTVVLSK